VEAAAGSVLVFDNRLWHKGGKNLSSGKRAFLGIKYIPSWLNIHIRRCGSRIIYRCRRMFHAGLLS
jgi:ectoine hydroxylase-related dioxygenase (phytanoyl-CoA dioxygenase family)